MIHSLVFVTRSKIRSEGNRGLIIFPVCRPIRCRPADIIFRVLEQHAVVQVVVDLNGQLDGISGVDAVLQTGVAVLLVAHRREGPQRHHRQHHRQRQQRRKQFFTHAMFFHNTSPSTFRKMN